ncbi:MAG TPA: pyridoxal phosphate-dependent aminotransferase [Desulfobacteria bacterium]|nr:pyridoxal phosphate-dependent aminotransferase [Desulfobacteria bacterium]
MRTNIVHLGAGELTYEIRGIMQLVETLSGMGMEITLENIGDPVAKGEEIPHWLKSIIADLAMENDSYAYSATLGDVETRKYLASLTNRNSGVHLHEKDIIFFNGLGDAITKIYGFMRRTARVITPSPTYTTHSSSEAAHAGLPPVCYPLDPQNHWYPDVAELRRRVKYNPAVAAILIINPDNPTGMVYPEALLEEIVSIARDFDLFIIADEIYLNLAYNGHKGKCLSEVIGNVPAISMKGISKELPWPGGRCGWIEVYNADRDPMFADYIKSIINAKMVEVCSTTLPQKAIPRVFEHPAYADHLLTRRKRYEHFSEIGYKKLKDIPGIMVNQTNGAFYMTVVFEEGRLNRQQTLTIARPDVRELIESLTAKDEKMQPDKRFVYYLLGATGICVVPLTSFSSDLQGFRITLLETDEDRFRKTFDTLADSIRQYLASA